MGWLKIGFEPHRAPRSEDELLKGTLNKWELKLLLLTGREIAPERRVLKYQKGSPDRSRLSPNFVDLFRRFTSLVRVFNYFFNRRNIAMPDAKEIHTLTPCRS